MNLELCIIDSSFGSVPNYTRSTLLTCVVDKTRYEFPHSPPQPKKFGGTAKAVLNTLVVPKAVEDAL